MVRDLGNPEFAKEVEEGIARRSVSKKLVVRRNVLEKTVEDVAKELGWAVEKANDFEFAENAEMNGGDPSEYRRVLGLKVGDVRSFASR